MRDQGRHGPRVVSFSGIDGAGKSSQIAHLAAVFEDRGLRVRVIPFWDAIATLKGLRESVGHSVFKGDKGVGHPSTPINRRDKNVRSAPMTLVRLFLYSLDALSNRRAVKNAMSSGEELIIFDRYIYDELANLNLSNPMLRSYAKAMLNLVPQPHVSFLLDADPAQARARKPEYPLDFLIENRRSYLDLSTMVDTMTVVPALPIDQVKQIVVQRALELLSGNVGAAKPIPPGATCPEGIFSGS